MNYNKLVMLNPTPKQHEELVPGFNYPIKSRIKLARPENNAADFFELIRQRSSIRTFKKLKPGDLDQLLWYSDKAFSVDINDRGYILYHRPVPSAGARHPIDILVCLDVSRPVLHYYDPFTHALGQLDLDEPIVQGFLMHVQQNLPVMEGVLLWLIAHPARTEAKYENAESLVWRDAGALIQQIQLTATALGLGSCPIGTLGVPFEQQLFGNIGRTIAAGGIVVGNLEL